LITAVPAAERAKYPVAGKDLALANANELQLLIDGRRSVLDIKKMLDAQYERKSTLQAIFNHIEVPQAGRPGGDAIGAAGLERKVMKLRRKDAVHFGAAALSLLALVFAAGCRRPEPPAPVAKHVILFIGDGMSLGSEIAASRYLYGHDRGLAWHPFAVKAYVATWDVTVVRQERRGRRPTSVPGSGVQPVPRIRRQARGAGAPPVGHAVLGPGGGHEDPAVRRFGRGRHGHGHGAKDGLGPRLLAARQRSGRASPDARRGLPGQTGRGRRGRQHGALQSCDTGALRQPQHQQDALLHRL
jgi:hypothetical protein